MEQTAPIHTCRPGGRRPKRPGDRGGPHWLHVRLYLDLPTARRRRRRPSFSLVA